MVNFRFSPMELTYKVIDGKPVIHIYGKTDKGKSICVIDDTFKPYFYAMPKKNADLDALQKKISAINIDKRDYLAKVDGIEDVEMKYKGKEVRVLKIFTNVPHSISTIRDEIKDMEDIANTFEHDILFTRRYLIDKNITPLLPLEVEGEFINVKSRVSVARATSIINKEGEEDIGNKMIAFDIETYNPAGRGIMPEENPVLMVAFYGENFKKVITWGKFETENKDIEFVKDEAELIQRFKAVIDSEKPDILCGYYSDGFDFPYLKTRAEKNKIKLDIGLDYTDVKIGRGKIPVASANGITHLDIFKFVKRVIGRSLETDNFDLSSVAQELIGEKKKDVDLDDLTTAWDNKPEELEKFCEYNIHDSYLTYKLSEKLMPNIIELVKLVGLTISDITRMGFSQLVEWFLIRQAKQFKEITPNNPGNEEIGKRRSKTFEGAFVFEPIPGLYNDIVVFDFRSLYPTIISSHNIGPETLNCKCCEDSAKRIHTSDKAEFWFCEKKKGFVPSVIGEIIKRRMRVKSLMKEESSALLEARQASLKLLANSFYGYLGFFGARWYSFESARCVTAYGRQYIKQVIEKAEKNGFKVLYSDTDSVFLALGEKKKEDSIKFVETINLTLPGLMELEYEAFYPSGIFVSAKMGTHGAKKKYALIRDDGYVKIKGFETVRRNWSAIAKDTQETVLNIILKENDPEKAVKHVKEVIKDLREGRVETEKVLMHTQLQKNISEYENIGPHVAAATRMKNRGIPVGPGSIIKFIVTTGTGRIRDRIKLRDEVKKGEYDADYYINNQLLPSVEKILDVLGFSAEELKEAKTQSKLDSFLS